jgi:LmbE family N-acetylglucosaminyl deacetylase
VRQSIGRTLNIVAHEDDDLLFLSPDLLHTIQSGCMVRTIFLTAGDHGASATYWQGREFGIQAAYAQMGGVANVWTQADAGISGHSIPIFTLSGYPSVSLAFLRLPDGNSSGCGFPSTHHESLQQLWLGSILTIHTVDGSSCYGRATLIQTLVRLIASFQADLINTQDYVGIYGDGDHSDHHSVAYFVRDAMQHASIPQPCIGYESYITAFRPANVSGAALTMKQDAFYAYAHHDSLIGGVPETFPARWRMSVTFRRFLFLLRSLRGRTRCLRQFIAHPLNPKWRLSCTDMDFATWLRRQYTVEGDRHKLIE